MLPHNETTGCEPFHIMIADDDESSLILLKEAMNSCGYRTTGVADSEAIIHTAKTVVPDLLLLDIMMPKISGFEICQRIKNDAELAGMVIIFVSANVNIDVKTKGLAMGAVDFITKPFQIADVRARVALHLEIKKHQLELLRVNARLREEIAVANCLREEVETRQAQLVMAEKLASIGSLAAGIAHEINNPLEIVKGFTYILGKKLRAAGPSADNETILTTVNEAIARIATIVNSVRDFAQFDTNQQEALDVNDTVGKAIGFIHHISKTDGIEVQKKFVTDAPLIRASFSKIQQVIVCLLTNACDAMESRPPQDRHIVVETSVVGDNVMISVTDNGHGIPEAMLSKVFDPFFTTKPVGKGVGLGLSISRSIIDSLGGSIEVSSQDGKGSLFKIILPRMQTLGVERTLTSVENKPHIPALS